MDMSWQDSAACKGADLRIFFPSTDDHGMRRLAKSYCDVCPVKRTCLDYALSTRTEFGFFGGKTADARAVMTGRRPAIDPELGAHGDKPGTKTGYWREKAARVQPCDACREAHNADVRARRHAADTKEAQYV